MTDVERWNPAPKNPGYEVSDLGQVRSTDLMDPEGRLVVRNRIISQSLTGPKKADYYEVSLRTIEPRERKRCKVHHLVLEAFTGPRPKGMVACHNNGDRYDNRLSNLRWDTQTNNIYDMFKHQGGHWNAKKTHCKNGHELTPDNLYANGTGRKCRTCARERAAAQYAAKRAQRVSPGSDSEAIHGPH